MKGFEAVRKLAATIPSNVLPQTGSYHPKRFLMTAWAYHGQHILAGPGVDLSNLRKNDMPFG